MRSPLSRVSRRGRVTLVVLAVLLVIIAFADRIVDIWADYLWFDEVGYNRIYSGVLTTRLLLFLTFGFGVGLIVALNLYLAYRMRPLLRPHSAEQHALDRYRMLMLPRMGMWITVLATLVGLFAGLSAQGRWQLWLLFQNSQKFGIGDPQFKVDIGFYVFEYPFYRYLLGVGFGAVVIALLGALGLHYLLGGVRLQGAGDRMTAPARAHLTSLVAAFVLLKAAAYFLDRRGLLLGSNPSVENLNGASYTAINSLLPAKEVLAWISLLVAIAIIVFSNAFMRNLVWPGVALGLLGVSAVVIGGIIPASVQSFTVKPSARAKEAPFINESIKATRSAYGLGNVETKQYTDNTVPPQNLAADTGTIPNVRLLDPAVVNDTFTLRQRTRPFYQFPAKLDIDRYTLADPNDATKTKTQDYVVGVREMNYEQLGATNSNWQNRHTYYTHGYGFVAAPANKLVCNGEPYFVAGFLGEHRQQGGEQCNAADDMIKTSEPRIYYGEQMTTYAIVGKKGGEDVEFDRPTGVSDAKNTYNGKGGVEIGSYSRRMLYAAHLRESNFLLSSVFNDNSRLMYVREPRERVQKIAPFLKMDGDPYPAVVDGRVVWIIDAYTTSSTYPYSTRVDLRSSTSDAQTGDGTFAQQRQDINYLRNSVKATVDAYDGTVSLYTFDETDPVLKAWNAAFGGKLVKPRSAIPASLAQHFRYPEDQFKVQRDLLSRFHVTDPAGFYGQNDFWQVPDDPNKAGVKQPPYYLLATPPEQSEATFQLTAAMVQGPALSGVVSGSYDKDNRPMLRVLELPDNSAIQGPDRAHQRMTNQDDTARVQINQLKSDQAQIEFGNLLTLPLLGGVLYVQPLYIRSTQANSFPTMKKVLLNYGEYSAYADNMTDGLKILTDKAAGKAPTAGTENPPPTAGGQPPAGGDPVAQAAARIDAAITKLREAQKSGDFAAQGAALKELDEATKAYEEARRNAGATPGASPTPSGSPSASPSPSASAGPPG
jgi:uncharacterized membrane protein (UPF0182 family)